jgi:hypothetical protein
MILSDDEAVIGKRKQGTGTLVLPKMSFHVSLDVIQGVVFCSLSLSLSLSHTHTHTQTHTHTHTHTCTPRLGGAFAPTPKNPVTNKATQATKDGGASTRSKGSALKLKDRGGVDKQRANRDGAGRGGTEGRYSAGGREVREVRVPKKAAPQRLSIPKPGGLDLGKAGGAAQRASLSSPTSTDEDVPLQEKLNSLPNSVPTSRVTTPRLNSVTPIASAGLLAPLTGGGGGGGGRPAVPVAPKVSIPRKRSVPSQATSAADAHITTAGVVAPATTLARARGAFSVQPDGVGAGVLHAAAREALHEQAVETRAVLQQVASGWSESCKVTTIDEVVCCFGRWVCGVGFQVAELDFRWRDLRWRGAVLKGEGEKG